MDVRKTKLDKSKRVKAVARKRVGSPKPARILDERAGRVKSRYQQSPNESAGEE